MREILFRGKRKDNSEWIEGFYFCMVHDDGSHVHHFIMPLGVDLSFGTPIESIQVEVDPETVCQYTGLADRNGRKIFEGDIVKVRHEKYKKENGDNFSIFPEVVQYKRNYAIEFVCKGGHCGYRCRNKSIHFPITPNVIYNHKVEVIGNISDNSELIIGEAEDD